MNDVKLASLAGAVVVFDLDGTLVDTAPDLVGALNVVLGECGLPPHGFDKARHLVGHGARALIAHGFRAAGATLDESRVSDLVARFIAVYGARIAVDSRLFPHARATLDALDAAGASSVVCTNKPGVLARRLLLEFDLLHRFGAVVGPDDAGCAKPDARHFWAAAAAAGAGASTGAARPSRCLMVGDSAADVGVARNAGVPVIVTSFGYTPIAPQDLGGDLVIDDLAQVPATAAQLLARALPPRDLHDIAPPSDRADA